MALSDSPWWARSAILLNTDRDAVGVRLLSRAGGVLAAHVDTQARAHVWVSCPGRQMTSPRLWQLRVVRAEHQFLREPLLVFMQTLSNAEITSAISCDRCIRLHESC